MKPSLLRQPGDSVAGASSSDDAAREIRTLYEAEVPKLMRFFQRRTGYAEDAADLAQDTFLRFVRVTPGTTIQTPQAYLRRIAGNLLRDRAVRASTRLERLQVPLDESFQNVSDDDPHRTLEGQQQLAHYREVLLKLKPKTLEIFLLHRLDGLTYKEIGARLSMSEGGVKRHMVKAIAHITRARGRQ